VFAEESFAVFASSSANTLFP